MLSVPLVAVEEEVVLFRQADAGGEGREHELVLKEVSGLLLFSRGMRGSASYQCIQELKSGCWHLRDYFKQKEGGFPC